MPCHSEETVAHQHGPAELFGPQGIWNGLHQIGWSQAGCRRVQGQSGWPTGFTIPPLSNHFKRQTWANESNPHQLHGVISPDTRLFSIGSELGSLVGSQSERDEAYRFSCHEATVFLKNLPPLAVDKHTTCIDEDDSLMKSRRWVKMSKLFCSLRATAVYECIWYIWSNMMKTYENPINHRSFVLSFGGWG